MLRMSWICEVPQNIIVSMFMIFNLAMSYSICEVYNDTWKKNTKNIIIHNNIISTYFGNESDDSHPFNSLFARILVVYKYNNSNTSPNYIHLFKAFGDFRWKPSRF